MKTRSRIQVVITVLTVCLALPAFSASPQMGNPSPTLPGQTVTLLPDGSWLVAGGQDTSGHPISALFLRDAQGNERQLPLGLRFPRMWHTATILPDGTVLILGGIGVDGEVVPQVEIFNPTSQSLHQLDSGGPGPRAFHSATLLTDGRVLVAGGISANKQARLTLELWDPQQKSSSVPGGRMTTERRNHSASLLADGRVLLSGGKDGGGNTLAAGEIYDPGTQMVAPVADPQLLLVPTQGIGEVKATSPEDGATGVAIDALVSMRFSCRLRPETINNQTVLLEGPTGIVDAKIVGAEGGMLAFVTPNASLVPGTYYAVKFSGAVDVNDATVAFTQFGFTTAGEAPGSDTWVPGLGWTTNRPTSAWQSLPPLQAGVGVTALSGQVLKLDGTPLKHVTLKIGDHKALSDGTGRFLMTDIPSGHSAMMILGNTANTASRSYGVFEVGVDIKPSTTNTLRYVIWMTPLDTAHAVKIPSPTTTESVVTSPLLPGLELHIPANTVIADHSGKPVTEITITPIPLDRPPFPLPNVKVPLYFTIQPGSAYIKVMSNGPKGARLFYPNAYGYPSGTTYNFWNYDPDKKGWYVYGQGRVSPDRSQIIPNAGVEIYEFTGAMVANPVAGGDGDGPAPGNNSKGGDPVDFGTGLFLYQYIDLQLPDTIPISLTRTYHQGDHVSRAFGIGMSMPYDMFNVGDNNTFPEGYTYQDLILADGGRVHFPRISPCTGANGYCDFGDAVYQHTSSPSEWFGATIAFQVCDPATGSPWKLTMKDGTVLCFPDSDASNNFLKATPVYIQDRYGNRVSLTRDSNSNLTQITSPNGRWIHLTYDNSNRVIQATDNSGRLVTYTYDDGGRLVRVVDANGGVWNYAYDAFDQMLSIQDPRGIFYLTNKYDANGRVIQQTQADNSNFSFQYTTDPNSGKITQTDFTDSRGFVRRTTYNVNGYKTSEIFALGTPEQQTFTYSLDSNTNLLNSVTDTLSRQTSFTYDPVANLTSVTRLEGTPNAVTTVLTYEPTFSQVTSFEDPLGDTTTLSRDALSNLSGITDPLGHQISFGYNSSGLPVSVTDALGNTTQFSYSGGDLIGVTDPLGNTTTRFIDSAGRVASVTDSLGRTTNISYSPLNQITTVTDPLQGVTSFSYDPNGNLLSLTDALNDMTSWTYDNMNRVITRTDPLQRQDNFAYDPNGNMVSATDRKGQLTTFQYDGLNRRTFAGFGTQGSGAAATYASSILYSYDGGNRLHQAVDSAAGTITRGYDDLDLLISEATPQGSISYTYDNAGRRASATVPCTAGSPACAPVTYTWDNANRLTQITQATSTVTIAYDDANRRSSLTLPNGVTVLYGYDPDSRLTGITYNSGLNTLGNLTYAYDQAGHKIQMGGSFARTNLPQPISSASYDAANELVSWGDSSPIYDPNGNMLSDGINAFTWNARNQLATLNGAAPKYDAFGRRTKNLAAREFSYDGANAVQELVAGTVTANVISGGVDENFTRSDSTGTYTHLLDALGSTLALTDANGVIQTSYTYEPFGNTNSFGAANSNLNQYTGRENDDNGIYYYRDRYYSSKLGRFISQDPIGFAGGINPYAYAGGDPINFVDPSGESECPIHWAETMVAARAAGMGWLASWWLGARVCGQDFKHGTQGDTADETMKHSMGGRKNGDTQTMETCDQSYNNAVNFVNTTDNNAAAIHALQDSYPSGHQYQSWVPGTLGLPSWNHLKGDFAWQPYAVGATYAYLKFGAGHAGNYMFHNPCQ